MKKTYKQLGEEFIKQDERLSDPLNSTYLNVMRNFAQWLEDRECEHEFKATNKCIKCGRLVDPVNYIYKPQKPKEECPHGWKNLKAYCMEDDCGRRNPKPKKIDLKCGKIISGKHRWGNVYKYEGFREVECLKCGLIDDEYELK